MGGWWSFRGFPQFKGLAAFATRWLNTLLSCGVLPAPRRCEGRRQSKQTTVQHNKTQQHGWQHPRTHTHSQRRGLTQFARPGVPPPSVPPALGRWVKTVSRLSTLKQRRLNERSLNLLSLFVEKSKTHKLTQSELIWISENNGTDIPINAVIFRKLLGKP